MHRAWALGVQVWGGLSSFGQDWISVWGCERLHFSTLLFISFLLFYFIHVRFLGVLLLCTLASTTTTPHMYE